MTAPRIRSNEPARDSKGREVPGIRRVEYESGKVVYRCQLSVKDAATGKRSQPTFTFPTLSAARKAYAKKTTEKDAGTLVVTDRKTTVSEACAAWLAGRRKISDSSRRTYAHMLRYVTDAVGALPVRDLQQQHVERLVDSMLTGKARRHGTSGDPLGAATVRLTVCVLRQVLNGLVRQGKLARNMAEYVELPDLPDREPDEERAWSVEEVRKFLAHVKGDRLYPCWVLSLLGLRRCEVLGLTWSAIDLDDASMVLPVSKTKTGKRWLPLFGDLVPILAAHRDLLTAEASLAEGAYEPSDHLAVDALGRPVKPRWYTEEWRRLCKAAGVRPIQLRHARNTAATVLGELGVDPWTRAAWLGHTDPRLTLNVYTDAPRRDALRAAGDKLGSTLFGDKNVTSGGGSAS